MTITKKRFSFTSLLPIDKVFLLCISSTALLALVNMRICLLPILIFLVCCSIAPFFPQAGFYLPIISRGITGNNVVALTFDDGPDPAITPRLLDVLEKNDAKATFFVIGEKAKKHPELMREIISRGHEVGNHSYSHDVLLMLRSRKKLAKEVRMAQKIISSFGIMPKVFRPPAGITNLTLGRILKNEGLHCVTFSCRGFDAGNRRFKGLSTRILRKVKPDDIVLLHDVWPNRFVASDMWFEEILNIFRGLKSKNLKPVPLSQLIGRPATGTMKERLCKIANMKQIN